MSLPAVLMYEPAGEGKKRDHKKGEQKFGPPAVAPAHQALIGDRTFKRDQKTQHKKTPNRKGDDDAWFYMEQRPHTQM